MPASGSVAHVKWGTAWGIFYIPVVSDQVITRRGTAFSQNWWCIGVQSNIGL